ncbi:hypothetical protein [Paraburkholderia xenovorans]
MTVRKDVTFNGDAGDDAARNYREPTKNMRSEKFNEIEHEAIVLLAAWEMLGGMVNYAFFNKLKRTDDVLLMFDNSNDKRLFNILLGDFLSQPNERGANDSLQSFIRPVCVLEPDEPCTSWTISTAVRGVPVVSAQQTHLDGSG